MDADSVAAMESRRLGDGSVMTIIAAIGWAVIDRSGRIFVRTVSDTKIAAMVNYLAVEHGVKIYSWHGDDDIEKFWGYYAQNVECHRVQIIPEHYSGEPVVAALTREAR